MPTYEYRCNACGHELEVQQKMSDPELTKCDACGADKLERLISWTAIRNSGWEQGLYSANPAKAVRSTMDQSRSTRLAAPKPVAAEVPAKTDAATNVEATTAETTTEDEDEEDDEPSSE